MNLACMETCVPDPRSGVNNFRYILLFLLLRSSGHDSLQCFLVPRRPQDVTVTMLESGAQSIEGEPRLKNSV